MQKNERLFELLTLASCHVMKRESDVMRHPALFLKGYVFIENLMKALKYLWITLFYIL